MKARRKQNDERNKRQRMVTVVILPNEIFFFNHNIHSIKIFAFIKGRKRFSLLVTKVKWNTT